MYKVEFGRKNFSIYVDVSLDWSVKISEVIESAQKNLTSLLANDPKELKINCVQFHPEEITREEKYELYLKLQELEKEQNDGRGVQSIRVVLGELKKAFALETSDHYEDGMGQARRAWEWDADKMRSYPELNRLMRQILDIPTNEYMDEPLW